MDSSSSSPSVFVVPIFRAIGPAEAFSDSRLYSPCPGAFPFFFCQCSLFSFEEILFSAFGRVFFSLKPSFLAELLDEGASFSR